MNEQIIKMTDPLRAQLTIVATYAKSMGRRTPSNDDLTDIVSRLRGLTKAALDASADSWQMFHDMHVGAGFDFRKVSNVVAKATKYLREVEYHVPQDEDAGVHAYLVLADLFLSIRSAILEQAIDDMITLCRNDAGGFLSLADTTALMAKVSEGD